MDDTDDGVYAHLAQPDHWTFLVAVGLVVGNARLRSRRVSAAAAALLGVALWYDAWEFLAGE
ncbi:MAG: hypothetical protein V5A30_07430 [Haloarculaceae archaeon]